MPEVIIITKKISVALVNAFGLTILRKLNFLDASLVSKIMLWIMLIGAFSGNAAWRLANWIELINLLSKSLFFRSISSAKVSSFFHFVINENKDHIVSIAARVIIENSSNDLVWISRSANKSRKRREVNRVTETEKVIAILLANSTAIIENLVRASLYLSTLILLWGIDIFLMADTILF